MLDSTVKEIIKLENSERYSTSKDLINNRKNLRVRLKEGLEGEEHLSDKSENYAGLVKITGRVSWKSVAEELARKYKTSETQYDEIVEEYRSNSKRLIYGKIEELNERKRQLKFDFVTPSYLGDET